MEPFLRATGLGKSFAREGHPSSAVFADIDLELFRGEIVCLLGASGSGKTSLMRILAGLDVDFAGKVQCAVERPGPKIGYLSQGDRLLPWRSALGNIALGRELLGEGRRRAERSALDVLKQVGLGDVAAENPYALSGGMQQRVLLGRALGTEPVLLLLDEPTSHLDLLARRELSTLIKNYVRARHAAVLLVTHSVEEACFLADRILVLTRRPARLFREVRLSDHGTDGQALERSQALEPVTRHLWQALENAA